MKKPSTRIAPINDPTPRLAQAMAMGFTTLQLMKSKLQIPKLLIILCSTLATTAVFGQTTYVWTNNFPLQLAGGGDLAVATNWNPNGVPLGTPGPDINGFQGDILVWDGTTTNDLVITQNGGGGQANGFGGPTGARVVLSSTQVKSVTIKSPAGVSPASGGWRFQNVLIEGPSGSFHLGTNTAANEHLDLVTGGAAGQIHTFINNSTNPCSINQDVRFRNGGGGAHPYVFDGSGDWIINHTMRTANSGANIIQKLGSGTMTWTNALTDTAQNGPLQGPYIIGGGLMIMKGTTLFPTVVQTVQNDATLRWDVGSQSDSFGGVIAGSGQLQVNSGTLTLSGQNTFTGIIQLNGGQLVANSGENVGVSGPLGVGGIISFSGGTLGFGNNTFDYSSRFSVAPGQAYSIDTRGQSVTYSNELASTGATLTKLGDGTLTIASTNSYSGLTTVSQGTLALLGPKTGAGNITVNDGATLNVFDFGVQVTPGTLTLGTNAGANLDYDNMTNTSTAPLAAGTIVNTGTTLISINSGEFHVAAAYPLLSWSSGPAPGVSLGIVEGGGGFLTTNGNTIQFNCTSVALVWNGLTNGIWDSVTTTNWTEDGVPSGYSDPKQVVFNDTATGETNVTISGVAQPEALTVNNSALTYSLASTSGNSLGGNIRLGKRGSGTLILTGGANTNTGVTTLRGGTVVVSTLANGGVASDIGAASSAAANVVFNGGTLQYTGSVASIDRLLTVRSGGGTLDNEGTGPLTLNNPGASSLGGRLTLNGNTADTNTLANGLVGGGSLVKNGTGTWVLSGNNTYGGGTTINDGVLQVGAGGGTGGLGGGTVANNAALDFNRTGTLTVGGRVSGTGSVTKNGSGTVILANNNNYSGGTTINAGTLQVGNGGASGELASGSPIINNATLVFNTSGTHAYLGGGVISGTGNVVVNGSGRIKAIGANTYTGTTTVDGGGGPLLPATFQPSEGNAGALVSSSVNLINNGRLMLVRQDNGVFITSTPIIGTGRVLIGANNNNPGDMTLLGTNTYTGGTFIGANQLILGDGVNPVSGAIAGNVQFTNNFDTPDDNPRTLTFNRPDDFTFGGTITTNFATAQNNRGIVQHNGAGKLTLTGNNTYGSGTVIAIGTLQVGTGGTSGSLGFGPVTDNGLLIFNRAGTLNVGSVSGVGAVQQVGSGTVTLAGTNTYTGLTVVSNGTLVIGTGGASSVIGDVELDGGYFAPGGFGAAIGELTVNNLSWNSGTVVVSINRASSPSNSLVTVGTSINYSGTGGTLRLLSFGPDLAIGDKFTIFSQPITNGTSIAIVSPGFTVVNNLAVDGSVTVATATTGQPPITATRSGGTLNLSWPAAFTGLYLQNQIRPLGQGITTNWVTIPGSDLSNAYVTPIALNSNVFYRLVP